MKKCAIVLFNLGGPDSLSAVRPFLFNLFNDPAIITFPTPLRWLLAQLISRYRVSAAQEIYRSLSGRSPILLETENQAYSLEKKLGAGYRVFVVMRYWNPRLKDVLPRIEEFDPDEIVLLPLYPQYSTTTSRSSLREWDALYTGAASVKKVCCYPNSPELIYFFVQKIRVGIDAVKEYGRPSVALTAHGLPLKIVNSGDPYPYQIEETARLIRAAWKEDEPVDFTVCYQSKVGPLPWLLPSTEEVIKGVSSQGRPLVVVPISFVSEHAETLVELDIEYKDLAFECGAPAYYRVMTPSSDPLFISSLSRMIEEVKNNDTKHTYKTYTCKNSYSQCYQQKDT